MLTINAEDTATLLAFDDLIPALREGFIRGASTPNRHHHTLDEATDASLLVMPSWDEKYLGVKLVDVFPSNTESGRPALSSAFILASSTTGEHLAVIDGNELTRRRTVATSALAASYLARRSSTTHLIVGAGHVGSLAAEAYLSVFDIQTVLIYDQFAPNAERLVGNLRQKGIHANTVNNLASAVAGADIITCATLATEPIIRGQWLQPGAHLDLIGSFRPNMRESDDQCIIRSNVYVDTPVALEESGDLTQPIAAGILDAEVNPGTLSQLCRDEVHGRQDNNQITLFKAVGSGLADLTSAAFVYDAALHPVS
ncbi:ornithine cyclodeaminase [Rhodococcus wratislaviensis]|uniref:Ornithine cyclodeaminase n=2 Tax=Rhodococcus wratislaviensis TaxID=44752 RepID=A0AB38F700_RHOWR|nr:ornithine cyclodeaminase family protein [Rhodococcus wratislaviensis]REE77484.1 ornithine cyclodeaminase [Rhodococcus wratislaviensis]GAF44176.1 ornithine cyclodeaminase/mu-crystallin family protein [Rhodococcus wratislaviensis NBRC 100605]SPZ35418.1 ornithine cyclodeaminase [Rhodococcus wratislaviensis]